MNISIKFFYVLIYLLTLLFQLHSCPPKELFSPSVKVVFTAAIIENQYEMRKNEYLYSLQVLQEFRIAPYILEACQEKSFFDQYNYPVFYPMVNDAQLKNKGVNEARLLQEGIKYCSFDKEDMLLKLTGRYYFTDDLFVRLIESNPDIDAFVKQPSNGPAVFTGCYALRCKYFELFLEGLDLKKMEMQMINIEDELGEFLIRNPQIKTQYVDALNLTANIFGDGHCVLINL